MGNDALKIFGVILDNSESLENEIRTQIYKTIGINSENEKLNEFIQECIGHFDFNLKEREFLGQLRTAIDEELSEIQKQNNENGIVNYDSISNSLMERLRKIESISMSLDDDFRNLSNQIVDKFQTGISREQFYQHLMSKKENILNMITSYNKNIVDSLIRLTPQLMEELQNPQQKNNTQIEEQVKSTNLTSAINSNQVINSLLAASKKQYNELQRRLSYLNSGNYNISSSRISFEKEELRKALLQLSDFMEKLSAGKYTQDLISKFSNDRELDVMCERIINEEIPSLISTNNLTNEIEKQYGQHAQVEFKQYSLPSINIDELHNKIINSSLSELIQEKIAIEQVLGTYDYDTNKKLETEYSILIDKIITMSMINTKNRPSNPDPTPKMESEIGNSKEDIISLIDSNQYISVMQAIPKSQADKYRDFITYGLNTLLDRWNQRATLAKSYEERQMAYQELKVLYDNFSDYIPLDVADMLRANMQNMEEFLQKHKPKSDELVGIRYNNSEVAVEQKSSMKM